MAEKNKISVCVFGSSSTKTPEIFLKVGYALGALLAEKRFPCVNGGGKFGVMGAVNRGIIDSNGVAIGVIVFAVGTELGTIFSCLLAAYRYVLISRAIKVATVDVAITIVVNAIGAGRL